MNEIQYLDAINGMQLTSFGLLNLRQRLVAILNRGDGRIDHSTKTVYVDIDGERRSVTVMKDFRMEVSIAYAVVRRVDAQLNLF